MDRVERSNVEPDQVYAFMDMTMNIFFIWRNTLYCLLPCSRYTLWQKAELSSQNTVLRRECFGARARRVAKIILFLKQGSVVYLGVPFH
jgi:hypothetical protein